MSLPKFQPSYHLTSLRNSYMASGTFFHDPAMNHTEESHPEAYKLLSSFKPGAQKSHPRLERTPRLLKAMQITAGLTLGLLAWDKRDRATAAKRYREALDLA